jgi:uncharacterized protein DUF1580
VHDPSSPSPPAIPIDLSAETLMGLSAAARRFPPLRGDRPVSPSTVWRWVTAGVPLPDGRLVRLEAVRLASRWVTSVQAIDRFCAALTETWGDGTSGGPGPRTPAQRWRDSERAGRDLFRRRPGNVG